MPLEYTAEERAEIEKIAARYPQRGAALLPVLHLTQGKFGHLAPEVQLLVAQTLDVAPARVREVVTFYEMYHEHPEGQFHLELCTNIACHLLGGEALLDHLKTRLGIEVGHQTPDGMFSLMEVECLASCGSGPVIKVGEDYYEGLGVEAVDALLERLKKEAPSLNGRAYRCAKGGPHTGPVPGFAPSKLPVVSAQPAAPVAPTSKGPAPDVSPQADEEARVEADWVVADAAARTAEAKHQAEAVAHGNEAVAQATVEVVTGHKVEGKRELPSFDPPPLGKREPESKKKGK